MAEEHKVTLHGSWASPFSKRVELALKVKGIPYEFVQEDLANKSSLLLQYNPIYKKIPILVHNGKPILESLLVLEYIDETWKKNSPKLLPDDPYRRAQIRFWVNFLHQQSFESTMFLISTTGGETREKAIKELFGKLEPLEEGLKGFFPNDVPIVDSKNLSLLDILMCSLCGPYKVEEEVIGLKVIDPEKYPLVFSWVTALNQVPEVKELIPPHAKLLAVFSCVRNKTLESF